MDFQDARISYLYLFYFLAKVDFLPIYCHFMLHCPLVLPLTLLLLFFSFQDLLRCRVLTSGIFETRFQIDKVNFQWATSMFIYHDVCDRAKVKKSNKSVNIKLFNFLCLSVCSTLEVRGMNGESGSSVLMVGDDPELFLKYLTLTLLLFSCHWVYKVTKADIYVVFRNP